jgi:hypothetical protein
MLLIENFLGQHRMRFAGMTIVIFSACLSGFAQQTNDLQQQLQELKHQYEQITKQLQQRISVLEQKIEQQKNVVEKEKESTVSAAQLAAQNAVEKALLGNSSNVGAEYQGRISNVPTYDLLQAS